MRTNYLPGLRDVRAARIYRQSESVQGLIKGLKCGYQSNAWILGDLLVKEYRAAGWRVDWVVPVPITPEKLEKRGFNQARILADHLALVEHLKVADILTKTRTTSQRWLNYSKRRGNLVDSVECQKSIRGIAVVIDDVTTSGATMIECARALRRAGIRKVYGLAVAGGTLRTKPGLARRLMSFLARD